MLHKGIYKPYTGGTGGQTNPQAPHDRARAIVETIRAKSAEFKAKKEKYLEPPETVEHKDNWT